MLKPLFIKLSLVALLFLGAYTLFAQKGTVINDTIKLKYKVRLNWWKDAYIVKVKTKNLSNDTMITFGYRYKLKPKHYIPAFWGLIMANKPDEYYNGAQDGIVEQLESPPNYLYVDDYRSKNNYAILAPKEKRTYRIHIVLRAIPIKLYLNERYIIVKELNNVLKKESKMTLLAKGTQFNIPCKIHKKLRTRKDPQHQQSWFKRFFQ